MQGKNQIELQRIAALLAEALGALGEQGLDLAGAYLHRCLEEVRRSLSLIENGPC